MFESPMYSITSVASGRSYTLIYQTQTPRFYLLPKGGIFFQGTVFDTQELEGIVMAQIRRRGIPVKGGQC